MSELSKDQTSILVGKLKRHCQYPGSVITVSVDDEKECVEVASGVFSSFEAADAFIGSMAQNKNYVFNVNTHKIDEPGFYQSASGEHH